MTKIPNFAKFVDIAELQSSHGGTRGWNRLNIIFITSFLYAYLKVKLLLIVIYNHVTTLSHSPTEFLSTQNMSKSIFFMAQKLDNA